MNIVNINIIILYFLESRENLTEEEPFISRTRSLSQSESEESRHRKARLRRWSIERSHSRSTENIFNSSAGRLLIFLN